MTQNNSPESISSPLVYLLALTTGLAVSAIYLIQPLLHSLSVAMQVPIEKIGMLMTLTQVGYAVGILFLIPLGDVLPKKSLIIKKLLLLAVALAVTGFSSSYTMLVIGTLAIGVFGTTAQDVVPFAADLSPEKKRGQVVGTVMSGLFLGILLSRTVSGTVSDLWGWQSVFWISSFTVLAVTFLLWKSVDERPARLALSYPELLKSTLQNFVRYPVLRNAILTQSCLGFAFSAFWTNLSFFLAGEFALSNTQIGLFGLAGAAGAGIAPIAGKFADKRGTKVGILMGVSLVVISFLAMFLMHRSLIVLALGAVVFDLGVQMTLISQQSVVYSLEPSLRARFNALFVAILFTAFSIGSFISVRLQATSGWRGVMALCLCAAILALANAYRCRNKIVVQRAISVS